MSKLYDCYVSLKLSNSNEKNVLYLFKSGIFFICIDEDAKIASSVLNIKLTNLNDHVVKCGFPVSSLAKYSNLLKLNNYEFKIIDLSTQTSFSPQNYSIDDNINSLLLKLANVDIDLLSVKEAYDFIDEVKTLSVHILGGVERDDK